MSKKTNRASSTNWKSVITYTNTCSVQGLVKVMGAFCDRETTANLTPEQQAAIDAIVDKDDVGTALAKVSAAEEQGLGNWGEIEPIIKSASFTQLKSLVHVVDMRLKSIPEEQRNEALNLHFQAGPLADLLAGGAGGYEDGDVDSVMAALYGDGDDDDDSVGDEF